MMKKRMMKKNLMDFGKMFEMRYLLLVVSLFVGLSSFADDRDEDQDMRRITDEIYNRQICNPQVMGDSAYRVQYANYFLEMRKEDNYFDLMYDPVPLYIKDFIAADGCYMTIYWEDDEKTYVFKKLCSHCSSLIYRDTFDSQQEAEVFSRWNLNEMNELSKRDKDKSGVTQITRVVLKGKDGIDLQMFTYPGFYIDK